MSHDADCAGCPECALPRRGSGAPSEAYYAARGRHQVKVRLPLDSIGELRRLADKLTELCGRDVSRDEALDTIIRCAPDDQELAEWLIARDI